MAAKSTEKKGTPARKPTRSRPDSIKVHVNGEEKKALEDAAEREMLPVATWARRILLNAASSPDAETRQRERERTRDVLAQALRALEEEG